MDENFLRTFSIVQDFSCEDCAGGGAKALDDLFGSLSAELPEHLSDVDLVKETGARVMLTVLDHATSLGHMPEARFRLVRK